MSTAQSPWAIGGRASVIAQPRQSTQRKLNQPPHYGRVSAWGSAIPPETEAEKQARRIHLSAQFNAVRGARRVVE